MDAEIQALLKRAQLEVKRASGVSPTPEEEIGDLRQKEMDKTKAFVFSALGIARTVALCPKMMWGENGPEIRIKVDSQVFRLWKRENSYVLSTVTSDGDNEIAAIDVSDPIFGSRLMVAIGSALE